MSTSHTHSPTDVASAIVNYCKQSGRKFVFLAGNGGSGKTELSKQIAREAEKYGHANLLDMDDFVVDTKLRNNATVSWEDPDAGVQTGRYTTAFPASYFLQNVKAILNNIDRGHDYYHWPKKARDASECRLLFGDAFITVVDGAGTVFLEKDPARSVSVFMQCSGELEVARRVQRGRFSNEQNRADVLKNFDERNSQYKAMIEPHKAEYGLVLESLGDFSLSTIRNDYAVPL